MLSSATFMPRMSSFRLCTAARQLDSIASCISASLAGMAAPADLASSLATPLEKKMLVSLAPIVSCTSR